VSVSVSVAVAVAVAVFCVLCLSLSPKSTTQLILPHLSYTPTYSLFFLASCLALHLNDPVSIFPQEVNLAVGAQF
jgi:hypothetical protein